MNLYSIYGIWASSDGSMSLSLVTIQSINHLPHPRKIPEIAMQRQLSALCADLKAGVKPILHTL